jgi:glycosyltransferase involved in cell wall biosynthesis
MKVLNLMLSRGQGGVEQAFVNSVMALQNFSNFEQGGVVDQQSPLLGELRRFIDFPVFPLRQYGDWDPVAIYRLHQLIQNFRPDLILCHGNRPLKLLLRGRSLFGIKGVKLIGFCHNFNIKHLLKADAIISVSKHILETRILTTGFPKERAFHVPNMIDLKALLPLPFQPFSAPLLIGTMGRFVPKKGFEDYIKAIKILVDRGFSVKALLGGGGDEESHLRKLVTQLGLDTIVNFVGWVHDKRAFYQKLHLFCLPSREEPFGIVALETLAFGCPLVATRTSGPLEFLKDDVNSLMCAPNTPLDLANTLEKAIKTDWKDRVQKGFETVQRYDIQPVSQQLIQVLQKIHNDQIN